MENYTVQIQSNSVASLNKKDIAEEVVWEKALA